MADLPPFRDLSSDRRVVEPGAYGRALQEVLDGLFAAYPVWAGDVGFHAYDDRWPDVSEAGREAELDLLARLRGRVAALPEAELSAAQRIDRGILLEALEALTFESRRPARAQLGSPLLCVPRGQRAVRAPGA